MESFTTSPDYHRLLQAIETIQSARRFCHVRLSRQWAYAVVARSDADCFNLLVFIPGPPTPIPPPRSPARRTGRQRIPDAQPFSTPATLTPLGYLQFEPGARCGSFAGISSSYSLNEVLKLSVAPRLELLLLACRSHAPPLTETPQTKWPMYFLARRQ